MTEAEQEILDLTRQMLEAMYTADPEVHRLHCTEDLTSFEWYIAPYRIDGVEFHLRLIEEGGNGAPARLDMLTPKVQVYGDAAIICYTLLKTMFIDGQPPQFSTMNETRVFVKQEDVWKMAHLHKSPTQ